MKWASNPLRKWPVTPVALISLWDQWAHPFRTVTSVAHRIHSWIRLVIPFLLKENWSWSPGVPSSACAETFLPPLLGLFSIARWMLLNTSSESQGFTTLSLCLAPVSACWSWVRGSLGSFSGPVSSYGKQSGGCDVRGTGSCVTRLPGDYPQLVHMVAENGNQRKGGRK